MKNLFCLNNKYVSAVKLRWIKHIYSCNDMKNENDDRFKMLNITNPIVMPVIIGRLESTIKNWEITKAEKQKKWRKIYKESFYKSLDSRSFLFKQTEKKEMTVKVILKEAKDKHNQLLNEKIPTEDLLKLFTTFKPCDYSFVPSHFDDLPITLNDPILHKYNEKLPIYRIQMEDESSFFLCLKIIIAMIKVQQVYEKSMAFITDFVKLFFKIDTLSPDDVSCFEYSESDRDILISILAPHILKKQGSEGDEESEPEVTSKFNSKKNSSESENYKDCLCFADLENQTFLELIDFE